jgi:serine/threonine-protein kinase RIO1
MGDTGSTEAKWLSAQTFGRSRVGPVCLHQRDLHKRFAVEGQTASKSNIAVVSNYIKGEPRATESNNMESRKSFWAVKRGHGAWRMRWLRGGN